MKNEIEKVEAVPNNLVFRTDNPADIIKRATEISDLLVDIIEKKKLFVEVRGKKYVLVEGWTTMLAMLSVSIVTEYSRRVETKEGVCSYEARVVLRNSRGEEVGSGEALASSVENAPWGKKEFSIKSMAQTRAVGKAGRLSYSFIMTLAGYQACNAEEVMSGEQVVDVKSTPVNETPVDNGAMRPNRPLADNKDFCSVAQAKMFESTKKDCDIPDDILVHILTQYRVEIPDTDDVGMRPPASEWLSKNIFQRVLIDMAYGAIQYRTTKNKLTPDDLEAVYKSLDMTSGDVTVDFKSPHHFRKVLKALDGLKKDKEAV